MSSTGGRSSRIVLLDGTVLNFHVHNKLLGSNLLYMVTSQLSLTEPQYFGLTFLKAPIHSRNVPLPPSSSSAPPSHHHQHREWLQLDKKILDQDVAKQPGELVFHFQIKFYVDCVCSLFDILTVELFYQQARCLVAQEVLTFDSKDTIELASLALQEAVGDYVNDQTCRETMKSLSLLTTGLLKANPSITYCENQVIERYKQLAGTSRGLALLRYIFLVERQPSYGQHYYDVKDKCGLPWLLGVGSKGLTLCDHNDPKNPRRSFPWHQLSNLNSKEKKFCVQLQDHKRSSTTFSSNATLSSSSTNRQRHPSTGSSTHAPSLTWVCSTSHHAKHLWHMAVEQHQFASTQQTSFETSHHGRSQRPSSKLYNDYSSKFISDLADDITFFGLSQPRRTSVFIKKSRDDVGSSQSLSSRSSSQTSSSQCSDVGQIKPFSDKMEYLESLKHKSSVLDQLLKQKIDHYQMLCDRESELTGTVCLDVTELLALSFNKTPYSSNLINGRVKTSMKGVANSLTSVTSSTSSIGEGSRLLPQRMGTMLLGTGFHLSHKYMLRNLINPNPSELDRLELELDLQSKIQSAALRLACDEGVAKNIKKKRKKSYKEATKKLRELESKVMKLRKEEEKMSGLSTCSLNRNSESMRDNVTSRDILYMRPVADLKMTSSSSLTSSSMTSSSIQSQESCSEATTTSSSNIKSSYSNISSSSSSSTSSSSLSNKMTTSQSCQPIITGGYLPSSVYKTRTQYRSTTYPTIPALSQSPSQNSNSLLSVNHKLKIEDGHPKVTKCSTTTTTITTAIKPDNFHSPIPHMVPSQLSSTNDEADLDLTLTGSCCDTTLNNSTVSDSFSSDTLKSSNGNSGLKVIHSTTKIRTTLSILPNFFELNMKSLDSKLNSSDTIYKSSGQTFSKLPSKTTSYLSIYMNGSKPESSKSDIDLSQMNANFSLDILPKSNLTTTLSNPATLSSQSQILTIPRLSLDNKGRSQISLLIKTPADKKSSASEDNFYDIRSKKVIRCESKDDFHNVLAQDSSKNSISPHTSLTKVLISPKKIANSHHISVVQLPKPEYMPCLKSNGKQFFNYPPPEVMLSKNVLPNPVGSNEQQFSYLEKVHKLRLRSTTSPPTARKIDALIS